METQLFLYVRVQKLNLADLVIMMEKPHPTQIVQKVCTNLRLLKRIMVKLIFNHAKIKIFFFHILVYQRQGEGKGGDAVLTGDGDILTMAADDGLDDIQA